MAVAFDAQTIGNQTGSVTSVTQAHTASGSNSIIVAHYVGFTASDVVTGMTWNGNNMTRVAFKAGAGGLSGQSAYCYIYANGTADGSSHNLVISLSSATVGFCAIQSASGGVQTGIPDSFASYTFGTANPYNYSTTVVTADSLLFAHGSVFTGTGYSGGTNTTFTMSGETNHWVARSTAVVGTGSQTLVINNSDSDSLGIIVSLAPASEVAATAVAPTLLTLGVG